MALVTTPGAADADAYISLADFKAYCAARGLTLVGGDPALEQAIRRGTSFIDGRYQALFSGKRTNGRDQSLAWPREGATDITGEEIDAYSIPSEVVRATAEAAFREATRPGSLAPDEQTQQVKREKIGEIEIEYAQPVADSAPSVLAVIEDMLRSLTTRPASTGVGATVWLLRA